MSLVFPLLVALATLQASAAHPDYEYYYEYVPGTYTYEEVPATGWGSWGKWGACSAKCDGGKQTRTRKCKEKQYGCNGASTQTRACNTDSCNSAKAIGCWPLKDRQNKGSAYRGTQDKTVSGYTCQNWSHQSPHRHGYYKYKYFNNGIGNHNYCRNPSEKYARTWCYTNSSRKRWDWCYVPTCGIDVGCWPAANRAAKGDGYRGKQSITYSGLTCQKWSSQSPHRHGFYTAKYKARGIGDNNYCRNPGLNHHTTWCYTTGSMRWDWCVTPTCGEHYGEEAEEKVEKVEEVEKEEKEEKEEKVEEVEKEEKEEKKEKEE